MTNNIKTRHLILRDFLETDIEPLFQIQSNTDAMKYTFHAPNREASAHRLRAYAAQKAQLGFAPWTVILQGEEHIIGWGGLNVDPFDPGWGIEVAYFFHPLYWGKGYATELIQASLDHGLVNLGLPEINAFVHPENGASARALLKCGFQEMEFEPRLHRNMYRIHREDRVNLLSG
jgi:ribosomal-protein-alanine N-acetyltransferase